MMDEAQQKMMALFNEIDDVNPRYQAREKYIRAPFGYAGSKQRSIHKIKPHLPYRTGYIEPFGGSGAVLLARQLSQFEVFNDRNSGITSMYRCLHDKDLMDQLVERLRMMIHSREEFLWCRDTWVTCTDTVERAARWYYMVQFSFGSLGRNFGRAVHSCHQSLTKTENHIKRFCTIHNRIKGVLIENQDWRDILTDFDNKDHVFYLDPPYLNVSGGVYKYDMQDPDEHREMLNMIFKMEGFVALSGYENSLYNEYPWDEKHVWESYISIKATKTNNVDSNRTTNEEVLWIRHG